MELIFYRSPFGLAEKTGLGRSALNNPRLYNQIKFKQILISYEKSNLYIPVCIDICAGSHYRDVCRRRVYSSIRGRHHSGVVDILLCPYLLSEEI